MFWGKLVTSLLLLSCVYNTVSLIEYNSTTTRVLEESNVAECDPTTKSNSLFKRYFEGMSSIYHGSLDEGTCLPVHRECGWPRTPPDSPAKKLPLFVLSVGLEGAGHHLWTEIMNPPIFDCVWTNARHYQRDLADGVPRTSVAMLKRGFQEQFELRKSINKPPCKRIYDAEDSFPTGAIRKHGRLFVRPDIINLQRLDGVLFNLKYLIIIRNTTDTALSALRRNFFSHVDLELRTVEHTLTYLESALRGIPCHKMFIAHYEHALSEPQAFFEPLAQFLEIDSQQGKQMLRKRLSKNGKMPKKKTHKLTQFDQCKGLGERECSAKITAMLDEFFHDRSFMWPTFAADGFDFKRPNEAAA